MESSKRKDYLSWDEFFMGVAILSSGRSKDPNTQVGACIVDTNNGFDDDLFYWNREGNNLETKYPYVCHAELNAILNYRGNRLDLKDSKIYVDLFPCNECAKAIIQSGINEVKYRDTDSNKASRLLFDKCGVTYRKIDLKTEIDIRLNSDKKITYRK